VKKQGRQIMAMALAFLMMISNIVPFMAAEVEVPPDVVVVSEEGITGEIFNAEVEVVPFNGSRPATYTLINMSTATITPPGGAAFTGLTGTTANPAVLTITGPGPFVIVQDVPGYINNRRIVVADGTTTRVYLDGVRINLAGTRGNRATDPAAATGGNITGIAHLPGGAGAVAAAGGTPTLAAGTGAGNQGQIYRAVAFDAGFNTNVSMVLLGATGGSGATAANLFNSNAGRAGIHVPHNSTLNIFGPGSLTAIGGGGINEGGTQANNGGGAGIGTHGRIATGAMPYTPFRSGTVNIHGGHITAIGGNGNNLNGGGGAGIGGGGGNGGSGFGSQSAGDAGDVNILGGTIRAYGGHGSGGIGTWTTTLQIGLLSNHGLYQGGGAGGAGIGGGGAGGMAAGGHGGNAGTIRIVGTSDVVGTGGSGAYWVLGRSQTTAAQGATTASPGMRIFVGAAGSHLFPMHPNYNRYCICTGRLPVAQRNATWESAYPNIDPNHPTLPVNPYARPPHVRGQGCIVPNPVRGGAAGIGGGGGSAFYGAGGNTGTPDPNRPGYPNIEVNLIVETEYPGNVLGIGGGPGNAQGADFGGGASAAGGDGGASSPPFILEHPVGPAPLPVHATDTVTLVVVAQVPFIGTVQSTPAYRWYTRNFGEDDADWVPVTEVPGLIVGSTTSPELEVSRAAIMDREFRARIESVHPDFDRFGYVQSGGYHDIFNRETVTVTTTFIPFARVQVRTSRSVTIYRTNSYTNNVLDLQNGDPVPYRILSAIYEQPINLLHGITIPHGFSWGDDSFWDAIQPSSLNVANLASMEAASISMPDEDVVLHAIFTPIPLDTSGINYRLPHGYFGVAYSHTILPPTGGSGNFSFAPGAEWENSGLTLHPNGDITGTPAFILSYPGRTLPVTITDDTTGLSVTIDFFLATYALIAGSVAIDGIPQYGQTLTAIYDGIIPEEAHADLTFQWLIGIHPNVTEMPGETNYTLTVPNLPRGTHISVRVSGGGDFGGYRYSFVMLAGHYPLAGEIYVIGERTLGGTLAIDTSDVYVMSPAGPLAALPYYTIEWRLADGTVISTNPTFEIPLDPNAIIPGTSLTAGEILGTTIIAAIVGNYRPTVGDTPGIYHTGELSAPVPIPAIAPGAPVVSAPVAGNATTPPGYQAIAFSWTPPVFTGGAPITGYRIYYRTDANDPWTFRTAVSAVVNSHTATGLPPGVPHEFRLVAVNSAAPLGGEEAVTAPATPIGQLFTATLNIQLSGAPWAAHPDNFYLNTPGHPPVPLSGGADESTLTAQVYSGIWHVYDGNERTQVFFTIPTANTATLNHLTTTIEPGPGFTATNQSPAPAWTGRRVYLPVAQFATPLPSRSFALWTHVSGIPGGVITNASNPVTAHFVMGTVGVSVRPSFAADGGPAPSGTYGVAFPGNTGIEPFLPGTLSGALPAGITISPATGLITGTPTEARGPASPWTFTVTREEDGIPVTVSHTIVINFAPAPPFPAPTLTVQWTPTLTLADVPGLLEHFTWANASTRLYNVGTTQHPATYARPHHEIASGNITVNVTPANAPDFPAHDPITIQWHPGLTLDDIQLPTGATWDVPATALSVPGASFAATYNRANHYPAHANILVTVTPADTNFPTLSTIQLTWTPGMTLADVTLPTIPGGVLSWRTPHNTATTIANETAATNFNVTFTPNTHPNALPADGTITVSITQLVFNVTFNLAGGNIGGDTDNVIRENIPYGEAATPPANPSRVGYNFDGWDGAYTNVTSTRTITARWERIYNTVTFLPGHPDATLESGEAVQQVPFGDNATPPVFARYGWTFTGWTGGSYENVTAPQTLTATWSQNPFIISFNPNGGTGTMPNGMVAAGEDFAIPANTFVRDNHNFTGWNTSADGTGTAFEPGGSLQNVNAHTTLFAQWRLVDRTVTFNLGGGNIGGNTANVTVTVPHGADATPPTPQRDGHTFTGWDGAYTNVTSNRTLTAQWEAAIHTITMRHNDNTGESTTGTAPHSTSFSIPNISLTRENFNFIGWNTDPNGLGTAFEIAGTIPAVTGPMYIYAQWTQVGRMISFAANGGQGTMQPRQVPHGSNFAIPANTFTRDNHVFTGWNTAADGTGTAFEASGTVPNVTTPVTLFAQWALVSRTVTFNLGGGNIGGNANAITVTLPHGADATPPVPQRDGFAFAGWDGEYTNVTEDRILTAQWAQEFRTITFMAGGGMGEMPPVSVPYGSDFTLPASTFTWENHVFIGWYMMSHAEPFPVGHTLYNVTEDIFIMSMWALTTHTITLFTNLGDEPPQVITVDHGYNFIVPPNPPIAFMPIPAGWNTQPDGSGTHFDPGDEIEVLANVSLFAQWQHFVPHAVIFDANGGEGETQSISVFSDGVVTLPESGFTRAGHEFAGWNYDGEIFKPGDIIENITASRVFFAEWRRISLTVTFHANGGAGEMPPLDVYHGDGFTVPENNFTRSGYDFLGWNTLPGGTGTNFDVYDEIENVSYDIALFAQWERLPVATHTVTFDGGGATGGEMPPVTATEGANFTIPANAFTRENYSFTGWSVLVGGMATAFEPGGIFPNVTEDVTFVAQWARVNRSVFFDANGGEGTMANRFVPHGGSFAVPQNEFTRTNYGFIGWTDAGGREFAPGDTIPSVIENITLFARWAQDVSISFDANGGEGNMATAQVAQGQNFVIPVNGFAREFHTFNGWNTAADATGAFFPGGATIPNVSGDMTLFAQWMPYNRTISFDANGGTGDMPALYAPHGSEFTVPANAFEKIGYIFTGWNRNADGSGDASAPGAVFTVTENATLYAQWMEVLPDTVTISFNPGGGTGSMEPVQFPYDDDFIIPNPGFGPITAHHQFAGWSLTEDGSGTRFIVGDNIYNVTDDMTLYAMWELRRYELHFDGNGADSGVMPFVLAPHGIPYPLPANEFFRYGYVFIGWSFTAGGDVEFADGAAFAVTEETTLFAVWMTLEPLNFIITLNANGGTGEMQPLQIEELTYFYLPPNEFTREGYTFAGWNIFQSGGGESFYDGQEIFASDDMTLFAMWEAIPVPPTVYFRANGGFGLMPPVEWVIGAPFEIPASAFTRDGFTFEGWNTLPGGIGSDFAVGDEIYLDGNLVLYAQWQPVSVTNHFVLFDANSGTGTMPAATVVDGQNFAIPANAFARENYNFTGWNTASDGTGTAFEAVGAVIENVTADTTLFAQWARAIRVITFLQNGGEGTMPAMQVPHGESGLLPPNTFARDGYTFAGWSRTPLGDVEYAGGSSIANVTENIRLYAVWVADTVINYVVYNTVTFNAGGGTGFMPHIQLVSGTSLTLPANAFDLANHNFAGWNTEANGSGTAFADGATFPLTSSITLFAQWIIHSHSVNFHANSGVGDMPPGSVNHGGNFAIPAQAFTRTGYTFAGWSSTPGGNVEFGGGSIIANVTAPVNLYAVWVADEVEYYTVAFNANGGAGFMPIVVSRASLTLPANAFTRGGYTFSGWNTAVDGSGDDFADGATFTLTENMTLFAQWEPVVVTIRMVSFAANGGAGTMSPQLVAHNAKFVVPANEFTRTGFEFDVWIVQPGGITANVDDEILVTEDITLHAQWTRSSHMVSFVANGGTGTMQGVTVLHGDDFALPANAFTRTGHTFAGWNTQPGGTGLAIANLGNLTNITATTALFAQWERSTHTVHFHANGGFGTTPPVSAAHGDTVGAPSSLFIRTGYVFYEWNTQSFGGGLSFAPGEPITVNAPMTLFAQWQASYYYVTFNLGGGNIAGNESDVIVTIRRNSNATPPTPVKDGYTFVGWLGAYTNVTGNVTITAQWTPTLYGTTILDGGAGYFALPAQQSVGLPVMIFAGTPANGFVFDGWEVVSGDITPSDLANSNAVTTEFLMVRGYVILRATWRYVGANANLHSVTISHSGHALTAEPMGASATPHLAQEGDEIILHAGINSGYVFYNWSGIWWESTTSRALTISGAALAIGAEFAMPNGNVELTANWIPEMVVTFSANRGIFAATNDDNIIIRTGYGAALTTPEISRNYHTLYGWYTRDIYGDWDTRWEPGDAISASMTLYARWQLSGRPGGVRAGDINRDTFTTSLDATMLARYLAGHFGHLDRYSPTFPICIYAADVNGDGEVCNRDLVLLAQWLVGHNVQSQIAIF